MAKRRHRNFHIGGEQLPLILPPSSWVAPTALPDLRNCKQIAYDRETKDRGLAEGRGPGWAINGSGYICGNSMAWRDGDEVKSLYVPIRHPDTFCIDPAVMKQWELDHQKAGVKFIFHNASYDIGWGTADLDVPSPPNVGDTNCMAVLVDENRLSYELDTLCKWRGIPGKDESLLIEAAVAYGYGNTQTDIKSNLWRFPGRYVGPYAEQDAVATLLLAEDLEIDIQSQGLQEAYQLEMDLLPMVHEMRRRGVRIDPDAAERAYKRFKAESQEALDQLSKLLCKKVGVDELRDHDWLVKTFTAQNVAFPLNEKERPSFEAKWMKFDEHWLPRLLVRAKSREEAAEKFIRNYILGFAHNNRLHASINQYKSDDGGARTLRFSYSSPPLQQMPHRDEDMYTEIRGIFLPEEGEKWGALDYSQQEYRLIVHYAVVAYEYLLKTGKEDRATQESLRKLAKALDAAKQYNEDPRTDFHSMVAGMTGLDRKPAKDANFAKSYGAGIPKFAAMIRKSLAEAEDIMRRYDQNMPFNAELFNICEGKAKESGFMRLLDGARIHFNSWEPTFLNPVEKLRGGSDCPRGEAERRIRDPHHAWFGKRLRRARTRKAMNALIQGGAARQTKMAMRTCWREGLVPLIQMHDELDFSFRSLEQASKAETIMRDVVKLRVPMLAEAKFGKNWGDASHSWEEVQ